MSIARPQYSIIIPTCNRAETLVKTLDSVMSQTLPRHKYEILIIDGGSTDNTWKKVTEFMEQHSDYDIEYFYQKNAGLAKARNLGIKESKGEIIFFTDDDCVVPSNWMATLLDGYRRYPDVVGVGGWRETNSPKTNFLQKCEDALDNKFGGGILDMEIKTNLYFLPNIGAELGYISYKKSVLEQCGRFDENLHSPKLTAKEINIRVFSRGYSFLHLPLKVKRIKKFGLKDFFYQYVAEGRDLFYLYRKYPRLVNDIYGSFLNNVLRQLAYAEISYFYAAYFFSILFRMGGRAIAKYWEYQVVKEADLLPNKTFEILKRMTGEKVTVKTSGRLFNKLTFRIKETAKDFYSIVIPTYNRAESLIKILENLVNQTIPPARYEIIIVDDGSTDDTESQISRLCQSFGGQAKPEIRYLKTENGGPAKARNKGIKESKGKFVFFTDDDCAVPKDWMETILAGFKKYPDVAGVGGWIWPPEGELEKSAVSRFLHFESFFGHPIVGSYIRSHEILSNDPLMCFGNFAYNTANVCYKKEALRTVGGFREDFYWPGSEDNELAFRIASAGHSLLYLPFHVIHPKAMSLPEFIRLHFRRGANGYLLRTMHQELLEKLKPSFIKDYGSMASFISRLNGPEKFLAFLEWLSFNAGIMYMKNKLAKRDKPIFSKPEAKVGNN